MKKYITTIFLILIGLAALSFTTAAGVTLKLKPEKGKTYTITAKAHATTKVGDPSFSLTSNQTITTRQSFTAKDITGNQVVIDSKIDAIKMSMSLMNMNVEYDSEHPSNEDNPLIADQVKEFKKCINKPLSVTCDATGRIVSDKTNLSMNQVSAAIIPLPKEELKVGSKWSSENKQNVSGMVLNVKTDYTVKAISTTSVDVSFVGSVRAKDCSGTLTGTANIDPKTGLITNSSTTVSLSMTIREQGTSMPVSHSGTTTVEVK